MPTLTPQTLSGLVVIPTVENDPGIWRVSLGIDVGQSRLGSPAPAAITREDLVVQLRHPAEGSFEPIASPDPGELPVRSLRVIQARAEFTFAQGVNSPDELRVTLRGDQKTFPMSQVTTPRGCLGREPQKGDPAPGIRRRPLLPILSQLRRRKCCVRSFDAPANVTTDPSGKRESFEMHAEFQSKARRCVCGCCAYRQFVRGTFTDTAGGAVRFDMPSGALDPTAYCEDGSFNEFGPGKHGFYGHRDTETSHDEYGPNAGANKDCTYRGDEAVSCPLQDSAHLEFVGMLIDTCQGKIVATKKWTLDL